MSSRYAIRRGVQATASQIHATSLGIDWNRSAIPFKFAHEREITSLETDASGDNGVRYGWRRRTSNSLGGHGAAYIAIIARPTRRITVPMHRLKWRFWSKLCSPSYFRN